MKNVIFKISGDKILNLNYERLKIKTTANSITLYKEIEIISNEPIDTLEEFISALSSNLELIESIKTNGRTLFDSSTFTINNISLHEADINFIKLTVVKEMVSN